MELIGSYVVPPFFFLLHLHVVFFVFCFFHCNIIRMGKGSAPKMTLERYILSVASEGSSASIESNSG